MGNGERGWVTEEQDRCGGHTLWASGGERGMVGFKGQVVGLRLMLAYVAYWQKYLLDNVCIPPLPTPPPPPPYL